MPPYAGAIIETVLSVDIGISHTGAVKDDYKSNLYRHKCPRFD